MTLLFFLTACNPVTRHGVINLFPCIFFVGPTPCSIKSQYFLIIFFEHEKWPQVRKLDISWFLERVRNQNLLSKALKLPTYLHEDIFHVQSLGPRKKTYKNKLITLCLVTWIKSKILSMTQRLTQILKFLISNEIATFYTVMPDGIYYTMKLVGTCRKMNRKSS